MKTLVEITLTAALFMSGYCRAGEHSPLLPAPQRVAYGNDHMVVGEAAIFLQASAAVEDRFAAEVLAGELSKRVGRTVKVHFGAPSGKCIVLTRSGGIDTLPVPGEKAGPDSREAYTVSIKSDRARVTGKSSAAIYYGVMTLCQLLEGEGPATALPEVEIQDWPSLPYRAVMVDMSHGPIVREEEVKRELDCVSRWKGNQYFFYTEASLQLDGYPLIRPGGQFTKDEVRRIIAYAKERHIDVVPNFDLFGHMHDLLRIEKYADFGHFPHGPELNPHDPRVKVLLNDWIDQFCGVFTSPFVNIGFDETWQIERLARKSAVTPASLFLEQMNTVAGRFIQHGKTVLFWADQPIKYPEVLDKLPKGALPVVWTVEEGQGIKGRSIAPILAHKLPHYLQRNVEDWQNLTIDYMRTWKGIGECIALGRESGAEGMITAMWLDSSQHLERISLAAYAFGLSASWQSRPMDVPGFIDTYAGVLYRPNVAREVASGMRKMTQADGLIRSFTGRSPYEGVWFNPFSPHWMTRSRKHMEDLHQARLLAEGAEEHFYRALRAGADPYTLKSLLFGARWLDYAAARYQTPVEIEDLWNLLGPRIRDNDYWPYWISEVTTQDHSRIVDMMDECTELREQFKTLWLEEYTPYRLGSTLGRWDAEYELWRAMQQKLQLFSPRPNEDKPSFQSVIK